jgi:hypothetical protein
VEEYEVKRILTCILLIAAVAALLGSASAQNSAEAKPDYWTQKVELNVHDVPLGEALQALFRGTPAAYALPDSISQRRVTWSSEPGASRKQALLKICQSAALTPRIDGDKVFFLKDQETYTKDGVNMVNQMTFTNTWFGVAVGMLLEPFKLTYMVMPGLENA